MLYNEGEVNRMDYPEIVIHQSFPGFSPVICGRQACPPSHAYGPAMRTYHLLPYVVSGCGVFRRGGKTRPVTAGEMFVIPPYEEVFYQADKDDPWQYIWIGFTADCPLPEALEQPVVRCPGVGPVFEDMQNVFALDAGRGAFLTAKIWEIAAALTEQQAPPSCDYVAQALGYIHAQYMQGITVGELADRLNLDRSYFYSLFKEQVGIAPQEYLLRYRMDKAAQFMTEHGQSITAAALSVGYTDIYHFSKMFKRRFGVSPRTYKKGKTVPLAPSVPPADDWHDELDVVLL